MRVSDLKLNGPLYLYKPQDKYTPLQFRIGHCTKITSSYVWFDTCYRLSREDVKTCVRELTEQEQVMYQGLLVTRLGQLPAQLSSLVSQGERLERLLRTEPYAQVNGEKFTAALNELAEGLEYLGKYIKIYNATFEIEYDKLNKKAPMVKLVMKGANTK